MYFNQKLALYRYQNPFQIHYYLYKLKTPLTIEEYQLGNHYMVGQAQISSNQKTTSIEIDYENVEQIQGLDFHIQSHKIIHIDQAVPKSLKFLIPKSAYKIDEFSETKNLEVFTQYKAPGYGDKVDVNIKTEVTVGDKDIKEVFPQLTEKDMKNLTTYDIDFKDTVKNDEILSKRQEYIMVWKLFKVQIDIFMGSIVTSIAGKQMKKIYTNNIKHLLEDYNLWKGLDASQVKDIRNGKNVQVKDFDIQPIDDKSIEEQIEEVKNNQ